MDLIEYVKGHIKVNKSMKILKLKGKTVIYVRVMNHFRGQKQVKVGQEH